MLLRESRNPGRGKQDEGRPPSRVVGAEAGSVFPRPRVSTPAARGRAHRLHPGPFPCSRLLRHLENGEVMVGAEGHQPLQPLISPVQQQL